MKRVTLYVDDNADKPEGFGWSVYSFNRTHSDFKDPSSFQDEDGNWLPDIQEKLNKNHAFLLSYYEHGKCNWSLQGEGLQCRFDSVRTAGILIVDTSSNGDWAEQILREDLKNNAKVFLETYTCWCNGEVYGCQINDVSACKECGHEIVKEESDASWCGFYGNDIAYLASEVRKVLVGETDITFVGVAKWLADLHDFGQRKTHQKESS